jgi:hypothetical protein
LTEHTSGEYFENNEAIQQTKLTWLQNIEADFCHGAIFKLLQCWQEWAITMKMMWQSIKACLHSCKIPEWHI